jgi:hypothetical protein
MHYRALRRLPDQLIPRRLERMRSFFDDLPLRSCRQRDNLASFEYPQQRRLH